MKTSLTLPGARTVPGAEQTAMSEPGALVLQHCQQCGQVQYPYREVCGQCLSDDLHWQRTNSKGTVCASSVLQRSLAPFFSERMPWLIGSVRLDCGPVVLAHLAAGCEKQQMPVQVLNHIDASGQSVLVALPQSLNTAQAEVLQAHLTQLRLN